MFQETFGSAFFPSVGATGFLRFTKLGALAHAGEGSVARLREGTLATNPEIIAT